MPHVAVYDAVGSMRPIKLCATSMSNGMSRRRGYITSQSAVRSLSVDWPAKGGKVVAAVAKIAVISSGIMLAAARIVYAGGEAAHRTISCVDEI